MSEDRITNTQDKERHPEWVLGGSPESIERQEAIGQQELAKSSQLPVDMRGNAKETLEQLGVKFLGPSRGDDLFQDVVLPDGWKKVPTSHNMWSELQNENGEVVADIFYKAAFYDRSAFLRLA